MHLARRGKDVLDAPADEAGAARTALTSGIAAESIIDVMESCLKAGVGRAISRSPIVAGTVSGQIKRDCQTTVDTTKFQTM